MLLVVDIILLEQACHGVDRLKWVAHLMRHSGRQLLHAHPKVEGLVELNEVSYIFHKENLALFLVEENFLVFDHNHP